MLNSIRISVWSCSNDQSQIIFRNFWEKNKIIYNPLFNYRQNDPQKIKTEKIIAAITLELN